MEEQPEEIEHERAPDEDIRAIAQDIHKGLRQFKNSTLFKIGLIVVSVKVVDVIGRIVIENQRLKTTQQDDERD